MTSNSSDFWLFDHGSIVGLLPKSEPARQWIQENIPDDAQWLGRQLAIELRYAEPIVVGIAEAGLTITPI